ncbi:hypothetical protein PROVALCAL_00797 [Providencia alcalifaciens DSM 30120]|uniref:Uncharacterized protein n=1 Tax=Providencia alcalifaciens DSM 30120 TaxID=520999 RepID=B6XBT6_9GAMM|nr:hypothetical protein PROVALCAL_00797 [Providencia alcalifaciens DSM 30120]
MLRIILIPPSGGFLLLRLYDGINFWRISECGERHWLGVR